jgi:hypothetical protein
MGERTVLASAAGKMPRRRAQTGERTRGNFSIVLRLVASQNILLSDAAGPRVYAAQISLR